MDVAVSSGPSNEVNLYVGWVSDCVHSPTFDNNVYVRVMSCSAARVSFVLEVRGGDSAVSAALHVLGLDVGCCVTHWQLLERGGCV